VGRTVQRLDRWESRLVEHALPQGPAPAALVAVNTLANGSRLWLGIAAVLAARPGVLRRAAVEATTALLLAAGCTQIVNRLLGRRRPSADLPARRVLRRQPVTPSFPSSHTAVAAAFLTAVQRRSPRLAAVLAPLGVTVAYGRIRLRLHWPTDVLAGAALGVTAGRLAPRVVAALFGPRSA
jgi:membrane-associated phospholipid phosphatase